MAIGDLFDPIFGDGGGGDSGAFALASYRSWALREQARLEDLGEREREQAEAIAELRRGELADRTGFAGLVNVGDAVQRSDSTLAAEMGGLAADDPVREAYEAALAAESEERTRLLRVTSGEQYAAEDAAQAIRDRIEGLKWTFGPARERGLRNLRGEAAELESEFDWFDSGLSGRISRLLDREEERRRRLRDRSPMGRASREFGGEA